MSKVLNPFLTATGDELPTQYDRAPEYDGFIEERDAERVPVVDDGRLVGVVSRAVLQRRLAEDEDPPEPDEA